MHCMNGLHLKKKAQKRMLFKEQGCYSYGQIVSYATRIYRLMPRMREFVPMSVHFVLIAWTLFLRMFAQIVAAGFSPGLSGQRSNTAQVSVLIINRHPQNGLIQNIPEMRFNDLLRR